MCEDVDRLTPTGLCRGFRPWRPNEVFLFTNLIIITYDFVINSVWWTKTSKWYCVHENGTNSSRSPQYTCTPSGRVFSILENLPQLLLLQSVLMWSRLSPWCWDLWDRLLQDSLFGVVVQLQDESDADSVDVTVRKCLKPSHSPEFPSDGVVYSRINTDWV